MKTKTDNLGDRMKAFYEDRYRIFIPRRTNVLIRIDGKAFHTYTKGLKRPHDIGLSDDMDATTKYLCENIQGAKFGYVQSDEISILISDYKDITTDAWFDNNLQKMCSIAASMATAKFNQLRLIRQGLEWKEKGYDETLPPENIKNMKLATFDARVFVIPEQEEVVNYFIWRQQDATRNSISMAAQSMFSHKTLHGKSSTEMQDMMMLEKSTNWNDYSVRFKRGGGIIKTTTFYIKHKNEKGPGYLVKPELVEDAIRADKIAQTLPDYENKLYQRSSWTAVEIPIFSQDRNFILDTLKKNEND